MTRQLVAHLKSLEMATTTSPPLLAIPLPWEVTRQPFLTDVNSGVGRYHPPQTPAGIWARSEECSPPGSGADAEAL